MVLKRCYPFLTQGSPLTPPPLVTVPATLSHAYGLYQSSADQKAALKRATIRTLSGQALNVINKQINTA